MPRPKCAEKPISDRHPEELQDDVREAAHKLGVTDSEWRKQAIEMKLKIIWVIQADWYKLRQLDPWTLRKRSPTLADIVGRLCETAAYRLITGRTVCQRLRMLFR